MTEEEHGLQQPQPEEFCFVSVEDQIAVRPQYSFHDVSQVLLEPPVQFPVAELAAGHLDPVHRVAVPYRLRRLTRLPSFDPVRTVGLRE
jgi:hypothetical protein